MAWRYWFFAAIFEMAWTFSLRFMSVKKLKTMFISMILVGVVGLKRNP